ncbi:MAG: hypothetical protein PVH62_00350 [Anaerolineae bacterium]|jgi:hypothetical protein
MRAGVEYEGVVAFALIKTEPGAASHVAKEASTFRWEKREEVRGVRWAAVITDLHRKMERPYDVMAAMRVEDKGALEELLERIREMGGVVNPLVVGVDELYGDGELQASFGHNGFP